MLIGNRNDLAIEVLPLAPTWERHYLPERTGWAQLAIWVSGTNLCENILDGSESVRADINVPLAPLVDWLVRSWTFIEFEERPGCFPPRTSLRDTLREWEDTAPPAGFTEDRWFDARELWWTRHFLSAGADGARLPSVSLVRTPRTETPWGRRFESARGLGHLLLDSYREGALGAASSTFAQPWAKRRSGRSRRSCCCRARHCSKMPNTSTRQRSRRLSSGSWRGTGSAPEPRPSNSGITACSQVAKSAKS